jgi:hypothetical protein
MGRTIGAEVNPAPLLRIILNVVSSPENGQQGPFSFPARFSAILQFQKNRD